MAEKIFINPLTDIKESDLPVAVFSENCRSLISLAIRLRTGGEKNHYMTMRKLGKVVSQGFTGYREYPLENFMTVGENLKFVSLADVATPEEIKAINDLIEKELGLKGIVGFLKNGYDFLGIFGQLLGLKFINNPWKNYCSERGATYCKMIDKIAKFIPYKPSPEQLNQALNKLICMGVRIIGYWISD